MAGGFFARILQLREEARGSNHQDLSAMSRDTGIANKSSGDPASDLTSVENDRRINKVEKTKILQTQFSIIKPEIIVISEIVIFLRKNTIKQNTIFNSS